LSEARAIRRHRAAWPLLGLAALWLAACATTKPAPPAPGEVVELSGLASWYGDEFAGRPTANGEIFDPKQLTAAHRTLPFGTLVDVRYVKTGRSTRVRVNDRGPFVGNRIIDLSFAAAAEIGMIDDGIGEVEIAIASVGGGELEPPKPYSVTIPPASPPAVEPAASAPAPEAPQPARRAPEPVPEPTASMPPEPSVVSQDLPVDPDPGTPAAPAPAAPPQPAPRPVERGPAEAVGSGWAVQLGAFSVEANAAELKAKVERIARPVSVERVGSLYRVRVGPWAARSRAIEEKERLESAGFDGIVVGVK
jgi:rare lipoprotein A